MFQSFKDAVKKFTAGIEAEVARYNNRDFLNAATALCARVAAADGTIGTEEKQKMFGFMQIFPALKVFDTKAVVDSWTQSVQYFDFDTAMGHAEANKLIAKVVDADAQATLIRLGCAIGASDGDFDDDEKAVVREVIKSFGLRAADFGL